MPAVTHARRQPAATIGVFAPASPCDPNTFAAGLELVSRLGPVRLAGDPRAGLVGRPYLAGADRERAGAIHSLLGDPSIGLLLAARGGYGSARLLPLLDPEAVRGSQAVLAGFSDVTGLHLFWNQACDRPSVHGPTLCSLAGSDGQTVAAFRRLLHQGAVRQGYGPVGSAGTVPRWPVRIGGGNLTILASLCGTPWTPRFDGRLLFIEETGEPPYRIDRCLRQLLQAGSLDGTVGVLTGRFDWQGKNLSAWAAGLARELLPGRKPFVVWGLAAGHGRRNLPLWFNLPSRLSLTGRLLSIEPCAGR